LGIGRFATFKIKNSNLGVLPCPQEKKSTRARERLELTTPICDDANLVKLESEVAEYVRGAKRRDAPESNKMTMVDAVAP